MPMQPPLLRSSFYCPCHRKFHMNLNSFKRSPVLEDHFFFYSKGDLLILELNDSKKKVCSNQKFVISLLVLKITLLSSNHNFEVFSTAVVNIKMSMR